MAIRLAGCPWLPAPPPSSKRFPYPAHTQQQPEQSAMFRIPLTIRLTRCPEHIPYHCARCLRVVTLLPAKTAPGTATSLLATRSITYHLQL